MSCWSFGGIAAAETSILSSSGTTFQDTVQKGIPLDLSERHLASPQPRPAASPNPTHPARTRRTQLPHTGGHTAHPPLAASPIAARIHQSAAARTKPRHAGQARGPPTVPPSFAPAATGEETVPKQDMTQAQAEEVLGLPERYDRRQLRHRFMELAQQYHPDAAARNGLDPAEAQRKMTEVNKAYSLLKAYFEDNREATMHRDLVGGAEGAYGVGVHYSPTGEKVGATQVDDSLFWDEQGNPRSDVAEKRANDAVDAAPGTHRLRRFLLGPHFLRVVLCLVFAGVWWLNFPFVNGNAARFNVGPTAAPIDYLAWVSAMIYPTYLLAYEALSGHVSGTIRELANGIASLATGVHVDIRASGSYTSELTSLIQKQWYGPLLMPLAALIIIRALELPGADLAPERVALLALGAFVAVDSLLACFGSGVFVALTRAVGDAVEKRYVTMRMDMLKRCGQWAGAPKHAK